ncbi:MAG TPA: quinone oxidoreductase [Candidatus Sulfotelmatobacter sp.]|nr:quinone oxidoreductase [Candidatus Sulfotelmatobacter sp.]
MQTTDAQRAGHGMQAKTMRAIRIHAYGGPEVMRVEEVPMPIPQAGQVVVRVHAASVNFLDVQKRRGELVGQAFYARTSEPDLPTTLGSQGVGVVETLGPEVGNVAAGDRVSFVGQSYATHAVVPAVRLIRIPEGITFEQAAAGMNQGFLAYAFTHFAYPVKAGDWCLIQAAAGGIGLLLCQMAKIRGGRVIGVTSTEEKAGFVKAAGGDAVIVSTKSDIAVEARRITEGRGVSVVYDGVGKDTFAASLDSLAPAGFLVIYGQSSGYVPPFDLMTLQEKGSLFLTRTNGLPYLKEYPQYLERFVDWVKQGKLSIKIARTYPLAEAGRAHDAFEKRQVSGRLLLLP